MNREELTEAILELAESPHMLQYALEHALDHLNVDQLGKVFDQVADHHELVDGVAGVLSRGVDVDLDQMISRGRRLCAHADDDGRAAHWLEPGQSCPYGYTAWRGSALDH